MTERGPAVAERPPNAGSAFWAGACALALAIGSVAVVLWQGTRVGALHDLSYILNTAYRIASGDVPFRDFTQPHPPLTFLIQAAILKLFDSSYRHHLWYAALVSGLATLVTFAIARRLLRPSRHASLHALIACLPLVPLGLHSLFPQPWYDADACFLALLAVYAMLRADEPDSSLSWPIAAGALLVLPVLAKQNMGLALLGAGQLPALCWAFRPGRRGRYLYFVLGCAATLALALLAIQASCGLAEYFRWTFSYAAERRLALGLAFGYYRRPEVLLGAAVGLGGLALLTTGAASRGRAWLGAGLVAAPLLAPLLFDYWDRQFPRLWPLTLILAAATAGLCWRREQSAFQALLALTLIAFCHGTFLSQGVTGSNFALWPFYCLLVVVVFTGLQRLAPSHGPGPSRVYLAAAVGAALLTGVPQLVQNRRLDYLHTEGPVQASRHPRLSGLHASGAYLPRLDELLDFFEREVPATDAFTAIPGEDPLYFALRRRPRLPLVQFDRTVNPWGPEELLERARRAGVEWIVVKRGRQLKRQPQNRFARTLALANESYETVLQNDVYTVLRRRR